jgi:hypothetical protein
VDEDNDAEPEPADPPADSDDWDGPEEPGSPPIPPGPGTIKPVNPCILIDCDPDPVIETVQAVDICKLIDCLGPDPKPTPKPGLIEVIEIAPRD